MLAKFCQVHARTLREPRYLFWEYPLSVIHKGFAPQSYIRSCIVHVYSIYMLAGKIIIMKPGLYCSMLSCFHPEVQRCHSSDRFNWQILDLAGQSPGVVNCVSDV